MQSRLSIIGVLVLAVVAGLSTQASAGTKRVCHQGLLDRAGWGESERGAKNRAVAAWIEAARRSPGPEYSDWDRAKNVSDLKIAKPSRFRCSNCQRFKNRSKCLLDGRQHDYGHVCRALAYPCKLAETGRDCRPRVNTLGDGAPNRRLAKDGARRKWQALVTGLHGTGFAVWSKAKESKLHCYNCTSNKAKNREVCGSVRTGDRCLASARPCRAR